MLLDLGIETLEAVVTRDVINRADRFAWSELAPITDAVAEELLGGYGKEVEPSIAGGVFRECILRLTAALQEWANENSSLRWLWMLRRLPRRMFEGELATTFGYDSLLAEVVTGWSRATERTHLRTPGLLLYSLEGAAPTRLARFCAGVRILSDFHRLYRVAGKGARFSFSRGRRPSGTLPAPIRWAVEAYDKRVERHGQPLSRLGTVVGVRADGIAADDILWISRIRPTNAACLPPGVRALETGDRSADWDRMTAHFGIEVLDTARLRALLIDAKLGPLGHVTPELAALLYLLNCASALVAMHSAGLYGLLQVGYLTWALGSSAFADLTAIPTRSPFVNELLTAAALRTRDEVVSVLRSLTGGAWPLQPGPVWLEDSGVICLNLYAASKRLNTAMQFPAVQGDVANVRASHFEKAVQAVIDRAGWAPTSPACPRQGVELRRNGATLTNIDAVGERERTLLLVSCKSEVYSAMYDIGDYRTVRNVSSRMAEATGFWRVVIDRLLQFPRGDNYDLSAYDALVGVVCTPQVVYVSPETLKLVAAPGLPMAVGVQELAEWLSSNAGGA